ncbi:polysaccharide deacetylase [Bifidobacterium dolichotidis]|uniref:Polysaccharide deacetylase n=1 Tax=Bifidobacterium dolichotidis TaxID=2306976 RepID=A0A430FQW5_9BIFI|nr:polysaccharide deacetylase family protein [Bifidobacterium dolichotidis]RSX55208.1 polysaccharide deacetylase [Bifidobacterium dolichotidis]
MSDPNGNLEHIEELSFEGLAEPPRPRKPRSIGFTITAIIVAVAVVIGSISVWWMWQFHWRSIDVSVDGKTYSIKADLPLESLLKEHNNFNRKPGNLLAVDGKVLKKGEGNPVTVSVDGKAVAYADYSSARLTNNAVISVTDGTDTTEQHSVGEAPIPFGTDINLNNGAIQKVVQQGKDGLAETWTGKISGKTVQKKRLKDPTNLKVISFNVSPKDKKIVALTFDDGPSPYTEKILDILKDKHVKATFFDVGTAALEYPQIEKRAIQEGNQVASHSASHGYMPNMNRKQLRSEIEKGFQDLEKASGDKTNVLRAPYGAFGVEQWKEAADLVGMNVLWNVDTEDWKRPGPDKIRETVRDSVFNGAVVLMHAGGGDRTQSVDALPGIIDDLKADGYTFVTINEYAAMHKE